MAQVDGYTADKIDDLMNQMVVSVSVNPEGNLVYTRKNGTIASGGPIVTPSVAVQAAWPVGSVFIGMTPTNPATLLGFTSTWNRIAQGRTLFGQSSESEFLSVDTTGGAKTTTLNEANIPTHRHSIGSHNHTYELSYDTSNIQPGSGTAKTFVTEIRLNNSLGTDRTNTTTWENTKDSGPVGLGEPFSNLPPYVVCFIWRRVA